MTTLVSGRWRSNCYVVVEPTSREAIVIDPTEDIDALRGHLVALRLVAVLLTHGHYDHVAGAQALLEDTGAECWIHEEDVDLMQQAPTYAAVFDRQPIRVPAAVTAFAGRAAFRLGPARVVALPLPGHTRGSVGYRIDDLLFTGDTLMRGAIGRTDLPGGSATELRASISRMLTESANDVSILPGHDRPWTIREARQWWEERQNH